MKFPEMLQELEHEIEFFKFYHKFIPNYMY